MIYASYPCHDINTVGIEEGTGGTTGHCPTCNKRWDFVISSFGGRLWVEARYLTVSDVEYEEVNRDS